MRSRATTQSPVGFARRHGYLHTRHPRETANGMLAGELTVGNVPNSIRRHGAAGTGDDSAAVAQALTRADSLTVLNLDGEFSCAAFNNELGARFEGEGFILEGDVVKTPWGRRAPLSFGAEYMYAFHSRILAGNTWRATFTGDSTTAGTNVSAGFTFPELFLKAAQRRGAIGCTTRNRGQAGETTESWLSTFLSGAGNDLDPQPHLLVVRWGINDAYVAALTPEETIANIRTGLATIRATYGVKDTAIILCTPNSTSDTAQGRDERYYEKIIHGFRQAALDFQCGFVDIYSLFQDSRGGTYASGNSAAQLWMDDPYADGRAIHPGDELACVIASAVADLALRGLELAHGGVSMDKGSFFTKDATDLPSTYPTGISFFRTDAGFPLDGFVITFNHPDDGQFQTNYGYSSIATRSVRTRFGRAGAWDAWDGEFIAIAGGVGFSNGWSNVGGSASAGGFTRDAGGRVHLHGRITGGTATAGTTLFTLPTGYRPASNEVFAVASDGALGQVQVVGASGVVSIIMGNNSYLCLDGISFQATQ